MEKSIDQIIGEFRFGFEFIANYPRSITVFGSSQTTEGEKYYSRARSLGARIAKEIGCPVVTGGGPGIMEAANRGAYEAGGQSVGITIKLPHVQVTNRFLTAKIGLTHLFVRKVCLSYTARAFIFFPGGFGTLDELFEILTLVQTQKIPAAPIILVGAEYWRPLVAFIRGELLNRKMIDPEDTAIFTVLDDENEILTAIQSRV